MPGALSDGISVALKGGYAGCDRFPAHPFVPVSCCGLFEAAALAEDPPFGGLWCDQPAPFSFLRRAFYLCRPDPLPASLRTSGTKVLKSTGLGTCRSNPASIAAAASLLEA